MNWQEIQDEMVKWAGAAQAAIEAGKDLVPFVKIAIDTFSGGGVTAEKLKALQDYNDAKSAELQAPLEPEEGDGTQSS